MSKPAIFKSKSGRKIAYHKTNGTGPGVVFLGGFKSDMDGTKATYLESWARDRGVLFYGLIIRVMGNHRMDLKMGASVNGQMMRNRLFLV